MILGQSSSLAVNTDFWYEWSLALKPADGFVFENRASALYDEREARITTSISLQVGRAVAKCLSLKVRKDALVDYIMVYLVWVSYCWNNQTQG
jgi:hypothetical protein